jgi:hypothetical protein
VVIAVVGAIGDGPLHQPDNVWTNWIVQIGLIILALRVNEWYPDYAKASAEERAGAGNPAVVLLKPLAGYIVPLGIAVLVFNAGPAWVGIVLIVAGVAATNLLGGADAPTLVER